MERILKVTKKSGNRERDVGCCLYETAVSERLFTMSGLNLQHKSLGRYDRVGDNIMVEERSKINQSQLWAHRSSSS